MAKSKEKNTKHIPPAPAKENTIPRKTFAWLLVIAAVLVYAGTVNHDYAYDDFSVIKENVIVTKGISAIPEIGSTPYRWGYFHTSNDMYRPLSLVMFATEYQLFGGDPAISHLLNILIYVGCIVLFFVFLDHLFYQQKTPVAFIAALLFCLHPVHTEVVANIKSRDELLCFLFAMGSLVMFIKYAERGKPKQLITGALLLLLSLLSKETSITWLFIVPVVFFLYRREKTNRSWQIVAATGLASALFLVLRYTVLSSHEANHITDVLFIDNFLSGAPTASVKIATAFLILGKYLVKMVVPYPLISDYAYNSIPFAGFDNVWVWVSILVYLSLGGFTIARLLKNRKDALAFGLLFYLVTLSLFSNILFLTGAAMAERFLFFASAGFCWAVAVLMERWLAKGRLVHLTTEKKLTGVLVAVSLAFIVLTTTRNKEWENNITLFEADVQKAPGNARLNYYAGNELFKAAFAGAFSIAEAPQKIQEAEGYLMNAITIYPAYIDAWKALGKGYFMMNSYDSSEYFYTKALSIDTANLEVLSDLDVLYYNSKKYEQSIAICKKVLSIDSMAIQKYKNIGTCFSQLQQYDSALYYLRIGMNKAEDPRPFYHDIAVVYRLTGNVDSARKYELQ